MVSWRSSTPTTKLTRGNARVSIEWHFDVEPTIPLAQSDISKTAAYHTSLYTDCLQLSTIHIFRRTSQFLKATYQCLLSGPRVMNLLDTLVVQLPSVNLQNTLSGALVR